MVYIMYSMPCFDVRQIVILSDYQSYYHYQKNYNYFNTTSEHTPTYFEIPKLKNSSHKYYSNVPVSQLLQLPRNYTVTQKYIFIFIHHKR